MSAHYEYDHEHGEVHKAPVIAMAVVALVTVALAASVSLGFVDKLSVPSEARAAQGTAAVSERALRFFDEETGAVRIEDAATGEAIARFEPGTGGFVRSTVRSLAHSRRIRGIGAEAPFALTLWENNSLSLRDDTTGKSVELGSFGATNRAVFAALLKRDQS